MKWLAYALGTFFGSGYSPIGPGTAGAAAAIIAMGLLVRWTGIWVWWWPLAGAALLFFPAVWAADVIAKDRGNDDPGLIVIDEVIGQWITLAALMRWHWAGLLAAFLLFRLFDIWKPWPIRKLEDLPRGWGVVIDDVAAGVWGAIVILLAGPLLWS